MGHYKGYEFFYVNGSSFTKGGGLEEIEILATNLHQQEYYKKYKITWKNRDEISWPTRLGEKLGIIAYNEADCGAGGFRAVRMAYRFIEKNLRNIGKFFIILELPESHRLDVYYQKRDSYYIVNLEDKNELLWATRNYYPFNKEDNEDQDDFRDYVKKFVDWDNLPFLYWTAVAGLYCFCKKLSIPIKILNRVEYNNFRSVFDDSDLVSPHGKSYDIFNWSIENKSLIWDEIDSLDDGHPGYFAHIKYANFLAEWLDTNLERNNNEK